jgi:hypothetical protein
VIAAEKLVDYRNAIAHGDYLGESVGGPSFMRNPLWHGEVRKRPSHDAYVHKECIDLAVDAAWSLCRFAAKIPAIADGNVPESEIQALSSEMSKCKWLAIEARHLAEMVSHEKY